MCSEIYTYIYSLAFSLNFPMRHITSYYSSKSDYKMHNIAEVIHHTLHQNTL